jgi:hypothetical protein
MEHTTVRGGAFHTVSATYPASMIAKSEGFWIGAAQA